MTVRELINKLLDEPMDGEVLLSYKKEFVDERGEKCSGYCFEIDDVRNGEIMFTDWRDKTENEDKGMYIACKKCKYNYDGECDFYDMGSGNEIDMPCYREKELIKKATDNFIQAFAGTESEEV